MTKQQWKVVKAAKTFYKDFDVSYKCCEDNKVLITVNDGDKVVVATKVDLDGGCNYVCRTRT